MPTRSGWSWAASSTPGWSAGWAPATTLRAGSLVTAGATAVSGGALVFAAPLVVLLLPLWLVLAGLGCRSATAPRSHWPRHPADAGAAAALLGASQFLLGAAVPPLVSLAGASGPAMGLTMAAAGIGLLARCASHSAGSRRPAAALTRIEAPVVSQDPPGKQDMARQTNRRHAQGKASRRTILDATLRIAGERGYVGTTLAQVTKASGLPASSVYWHFQEQGRAARRRPRARFPDLGRRDPALVGSSTATRPRVDALVDELGNLSRRLDEEPGFWRMGLMIALETGPAVGERPRERFLAVRAAALDRLSAWWAQSLATEDDGDEPRAPAAHRRWACSRSSPWTGCSSPTSPTPRRTWSRPVRLLALGLDAAARAPDERRARCRARAARPYRRRTWSTPIPIPVATGCSEPPPRSAAESGYEGATISRICSGPGCRRSSLYWHFKDKDDLLGGRRRDPTSSGSRPAAGGRRARGRPGRRRCATHLGDPAQPRRTGRFFLRIGHLLLLLNRADPPAARARFLPVRRQARLISPQWYADVLRAPTPTPTCPPRGAAHDALFDGLFISNQLDVPTWDVELFDELLVTMLAASRHRSAAHPAGLGPPASADGLWRLLLPLEATATCWSQGVTTGTTRSMPVVTATVIGAARSTSAAVAEEDLRAEHRHRPAPPGVEADDRRTSVGDEGAAAPRCVPGRGSHPRGQRDRPPRRCSEVDRVPAARPPASRAGTSSAPAATTAWAATCSSSATACRCAARGACATSRCRTSAALRPRPEGRPPRPSSRAPTSSTSTRSTARTRCRCPPASAAGCLPPAPRWARRCWPTATAATIDRVLRGRLTRRTRYSVADPARSCGSCPGSGPRASPSTARRCQLGLVCAAAPVLGADGRAVAAVSVSSHALRFDPKTVVAEVRRTAAAISRDYRG